MRFWLLRFNHGVEIGARLAYLGHYTRTGDKEILGIANEELEHRETLVDIMSYYDIKSSGVIDGFFKIIGGMIQKLCGIAPLWSLDWIARLMEAFAVFNYFKLSQLFPRYRNQLWMMAQAEKRHQLYFSQK